MLNNRILPMFARSTQMYNNYRSYKNFGHRRQPTAGVTVLWHGFLTFTFIGLGVEWKRVAKFMLGDDDVKLSWDPTDPVPKE